MTGPYRPIWIDNSSRDPAANRAFYGGLFGWTMNISEDPAFGGYAVAQLDGQDVAGFGVQQDPSMPASHWNVYIGTPDAQETAAAAAAAGGTILMEPFPIGTMGTSAFIADPSGAVFGLWQAADMDGFDVQGTNAFGWAELNARGIGPAVPFYEQVFGWTSRSSDLGEGLRYIEFLDGDESLAGAMEMAPMVPAEVPSYWQVYFSVEDLDATYTAALAGGAGPIMGPAAMPGGRYAILADPQGGVFGLLRMDG